MAPPATRCTKHQRAHHRQADAHRLTSRERGYSVRWERLRAMHLNAEPTCRHCRLLDHRVTPASLVDHIRPHRGDRALLFDQGNLQSLCGRHHGQKGNRETGRSRCDHQAPPATVQGRPVCVLCGTPDPGGDIQELADRPQVPAEPFRALDRSLLKGGAVG